MLRGDDRLEFANVAQRLRASRDAQLVRSQSGSLGNGQIRVHQTCPQSESALQTRGERWGAAGTADHDTSSIE